MIKSILSGARLAVPAAFLVVQCLSAATVTTSIGGVACAPATDGLCTSRPDATTITFNGLTGQNLPYSEGIATYTGGSGGSPFVTGSLGGQFAAPPTDLSTYLTVGSPSRPNPVTLDFSTPITYFGLYLGSPDAYNHFDFYSSGNLIASFTGSDITPPATGDQSQGFFVNFDVVGGTADRVVFTSTQAALESDNHAYTATPEPMTMMLSGMGLLLAGGARRFRRKNG